MSKNKHNQDVGSAIERSDERIAETQEVFTPAELCESMVSEIPKHLLKDPSSTFIDNSAGCGNFIVALINKLSEYHDRQYVIDNMVYAVELMEDNHKEMCERVGVPLDHPHYVCHDALTYDYSFGKPVGVEQFF
tara:strand:- start:2766 stop:3167 length:402 start_codon:yes stop_codon:yes gene_type:complete